MKSTTTGVIFVVAVAYLASSAYGKNERDLGLDLRARYSSVGVIGRPVMSRSTVTNVTVENLLSTIRNEPDNSLTISTYFLMVWKDEYLTWNPTDYDGVQYLVLPSKEVWKPDIYPWYDFYNNWAQSMAQMGAIDVWITYDGTVSWSSTGVFRVLCSPVPYSPNRKSCSYLFGSLAHGKDDIEMFFEKGVADFNMTLYLNTPGIEIVSHSATKDLTPYDMPFEGNKYSTLTYNLVVNLNPPALFTSPPPPNSLGASHAVDNSQLRQRRALHPRRPVRKT